MGWPNDFCAADKVAAQQEPPSEITLTGNFQQILKDWAEKLAIPRPMSAYDYWKQRQRPMEDYERSDVFTLYIDSAASSDPAIEIELDENFCIPPNTRVKRTSPPIYSWVMFSDTGRVVVADTRVRIDTDVADLPNLAPCSEADVREAMDAREQAVKQPPETDLLTHKPVPIGMPVWQFSAD